MGYGVLYLSRFPPQMQLWGRVSIFSVAVRPRWPQPAADTLPQLPGRRRRKGRRGLKIRHQRFGKYRLLSEESYNTLSAYINFWWSDQSKVSDLVTNCVCCMWPNSGMIFKYLKTLEELPKHFLLEYTDLAADLLHWGLLDASYIYVFVKNTSDLSSRSVAQHSRVVDLCLSLLFS